MYIEVIVWNWGENTKGLEEVSIFKLGKNSAQAKREFLQDKTDLENSGAKVYLKYIED